MAVIEKKSEKLKILLSAAMALPGMPLVVSPAAAQDAGLPPERVTVDYLHANYQESDERMEIEVDHLSITVPIAGRFSVGASFIQDRISGASPVFYLATPNDDVPVMVKQAGASIQDTRDVVELSAAWFGAEQKVAANLGRSKEDDYLSNFVGIDYQRYFNRKNTTLIVGFAHSEDEVWSVYFPPGSSSFDPFLDNSGKGKRRQDNLQIGVEQLLDQNSRLLLSLTSVNSRGDLSDPYKKVYVQDADQSPILIPDLYESFGGTPEDLEEFILNIFETFGVLPTPELRQTLGVFDDNRPDQRQQAMLLARYSRYIEFADAGLHLDYRYVDDEWEARSMTLEASWKQALPAGFLLTPSVRYYSQDSADFYRMVYAEERADGLYSSDYRLAGFGALSWKLSLEKTLWDRLALRASYERYQRKYDMAWSSSSRGSEVDDYRFESITFSLGYGF